MVVFCIKVFLAFFLFINDKANNVNDEHNNVDDQERYEYRLRTLRQRYTPYSKLIFYNSFATDINQKESQAVFLHLAFHANLSIFRTFPYLIFRLVIYPVSIFL